MARKEIAFGNRLSDKSKSPEQTLRAKYDIRPLRLDSIYPSSSNKYSKDDIEELAVSISIIGLQHFITVKPADGDGQYQITDGERRYLAHRYLVEESGEEDFSLIMCRITAEESDAIADYRMHSGNGTNRDFTDADRVLYASEMRRLYEQLRVEGKIQGGRIRDYVAKKLKVSPAQVAIYNKIEHNLNPELWKAFRAGELLVSDASMLASMAPDAQECIIRELEEKGKSIPLPRKSKYGSASKLHKVIIQAISDLEQRNSGRMTMGRSPHKIIVVEDI